ncbi:MAG: FtsL-like putative cell division protein [Saprospiraceae bacterium]
MARKKGFLPQLQSFQLSGFILKNLGFFLFLGFLAILYIGNAHLAERNVRRVQELQREIRELRWSYKSLQSENMYNSLRSEVADRVADNGLRLHRGEPIKIVVRNED